MFSRRDQIAVYGFPKSGGGAVAPIRGKDIFVWAADRSGRYLGGSDDATGSDWNRPLRTMQEALSRAKTGDRITFTGKVTEQITIADITDLNLKFDITIQGLGDHHHADQPGSGTDLYDVGSSIWAPAASPETTTPNLGVYGRGWKFRDFMVDAPTDAAAFLLSRNALSGTSEYDASHAKFENVRAVDGKYFIEDSGGCYNVKVIDCEAKAFTTAAIANTSTAVANPLNWKIIRFICPSNVSSFGNATHIDSPLNCAVIKDSIFGTVTSTGLYIDLTGGNGNVVTKNTLAGNYATDDYVAGTGDVWYQNACKVTVTTAPDGLSLLVPAA